jgi:hypothetical protein
MYAPVLGSELRMAPTVALAGPVFLYNSGIVSRSILVPECTRASFKLAL